MYDKYVILDGDSIDSIARKYEVDVDTLMNINNLYDESDIREGNEIVVPNAVDYFTTYTVNKGDTLYQIARRYNINPTLLAALNGLSMDDYIYPNQKLIIPSSDYSFYITKEGDTLDLVSDKFGKDKIELIKENKTIYLLPGQLMVGKSK